MNQFRQNQSSVLDPAARRKWSPRGNVVNQATGAIDPIAPVAWFCFQ
jgi:hypothetical protein